MQRLTSQIPVTLHLEGVMYEVHCLACYLKVSSVISE